MCAPLSRVHTERLSPRELPSSGDPFDLCHTLLLSCTLHLGISWTEMEAGCFPDFSLGLHIPRFPLGFSTLPVLSPSSFLLDR